MNNHVYNQTIKNLQIVKYEKLKNKLMITIKHLKINQSSPLNNPKGVNMSLKK